MPRGFYVTDKGKEEIAKATVDGKVNITKVCFGDGADESASWDYGIEKLKHQFYEKAFDPEKDSYAVSEEDPSQILIKSVLPNEVSGTINEIGYKDDEDNLIIYGIIRKRTKGSGEGGELEEIQFNNWVKFENEEIGKVEIVIQSAEYDKVEKLLEKIEKEFNIDNYISKQEASDTYVSVEKLGDLIQQYVVTVERMLGTKANFDEIKAIEDPNNGDVWIAKDTGKHYVFVGKGQGIDQSGWEELPGTAIDLSDYVTQDELKQVDSKIDEKLKGLDIDSMINMKFDVTQPQTPKKNMVWFDMQNKIIKVYDGSTWVPFGAVYL